MSSQKRNDYTEVSRKSRVKMHKSGKHWVRTVMSQIGFIHLGKRSASESPKIKLTSANRQESATKLLRGLVAASAVVGGGLTAEQVLAEDTVIASEITTSVLANEDTVDMSDVGTESAASSQSVSESESTSSSESISNSESDSISASTSESISESESISFSESTSSSESSVLSELTIASENSQSSSTTSELSESSTSESTTSEETPQQVLEQVVSEGEILIKIAESQLATASDSDLAAALAVSRSDIAAAKQLLGNTAASLTDIQTAISGLQTSSSALGIELIKNDTEKTLAVAYAVTTGTTSAYIDSNGVTQYIFTGSLTGGDASENANNTIIDSISYSYDTGTNRTTWAVNLSPAFASNNQFGIVIATNDTIISREMTYYSNGNLIRNSDYTPYISKSAFDNLLYDNYAINITEWRTIGGGVADNMTWTFVTEGSSKTFYVRTATAIVQTTLEGILKGDGRTLYAQRYDESPLAGIDIDSLNPDIPSISESTSVSESISNSISNSISESVAESVSESVSNSESLSNSISNSISESVRESVVESVSESVRESVVESLS
ncbi:KxYKxGKxW signal peptide domain-containing protein [Streptococcus suis]